MDSVIITNTPATKTITTTADVDDELIFEHKYMSSTIYDSLTTPFELEKNQQNEQQSIIRSKTKTIRGVYNNYNVLVNKYGGNVEENYCYDGEAGANGLAEEISGLRNVNETRGYCITIMKLIYNNFSSLRHHHYKHNNYFVNSSYYKRRIFYWNSIGYLILFIGLLSSISLAVKQDGEF